MPLSLSLFFADHLLTRKVENDALCLPSPEDLKLKIIIKVWEGGTDGGVGRGGRGDGWKEIVLLPIAAWPVRSDGRPKSLNLDSWCGPTRREGGGKETRSAVQWAAGNSMRRCALAARKGEGWPWPEVGVSWRFGMGTRTEGDVAVWELWRGGQGGG